MKSTNSSLDCREQKRTLRPFADSTIFALDGRVQKRTLRTFAESTIFALYGCVQKRILHTFAYETAFDVCRTAVQNRQHILKQSPLCKTVTVV